MKKKLIHLAIVIFTILASTLPSLAYDFEVKGIYYEIISAADKTCRVTSGDKKYEGDIVIPSSVYYNNNKVSVVEIDWRAFEGCSSLTSVKIPNSVTTIRSSAFEGCSSLTSVKIPNSVTTIRSSAFKDCSSLTSINIPNSVTNIYSETFMGCSSLSSIDIPNSVNNISEYAFLYCTSLKSIVIPNSVLLIGYNAFADCKALTNVQLSDNLKYLDYFVFEYCENLESLSLPGSLEYITLSYRDYYDGKMIDCFKGCKKLKSLRVDYSPSPLLGVYYDNRKDDRYVQGGGSDVLNKIERLYLDREIDFLRCDSLTHLTLGEHISELQSDRFPSSKLSNITCFPTIPPVDPTGYYFTQGQYATVTVRVPFSALEAYKNAEGWKNFWNIEGFDPSGIDEIEVEPGESRPSMEAIRYDLNGRPVSEDYKGVVIVRFSDGSTKKIMQ